MQIETENVTRSCESLAMAVSVYGSITMLNKHRIRETTRMTWSIATDATQE